MAAQAIAHIQIHGAHGRGLLHEVAVATRASDIRANVRRMIETNVSRRPVIVNAHPGNVFAARLISSHFFDLRPVFGDDQMTTHAELYAGDSRIGSLVHTGVANLALQSAGEMDLMREGDGLRRLGRMPVQKIADGCAD